MRTITFMIFSLLNWGRGTNFSPETVPVQHCYCFTSSISRTYRHDWHKTGRRALFSAGSSQKRRAVRTDVPQGLQGAHMPGTAEDANPALGKAGPLIPPALGLGTHLRRALPAGVPRAPGASAAAPWPGALRAAGTLRESGGRARTAAGSGRGGAGRAPPAARPRFRRAAVTGGRRQRQVLPPPGRRGVPGSAAGPCRHQRGPAACPGAAAAGKRPGG